MYRHDDPRFRRRLNQITSNLETANENAQVGLWSFNEHYLKPCLGNITDSLRPCLEPCAQTLQPVWTSTTRCLAPCFAQCFPRTRNDRSSGRVRASTRGRLEHSFDFYDDWEDDENDALLALDDDEFERVVGSEERHEEELDIGDRPSRQPQQPGRRRILDYGSAARSRRRSVVSLSDPTVIPNQSYFGFLSKLPFNVGRPTLRYKPSAANLEDQPAQGRRRLAGEDEGALPEEEQVEPSHQRWTHGRKRSATGSSGHTTDTFSSRGDLFPSDEEADAIPIDDEFEHVLARQRTSEDADKSSGKSNKRKSARKGQKSPKSTDSGSRTSKSSSSGTLTSEEPEMQEQSLPTMDNLLQEERKARSEEEEEVERKREAAEKLARQRGLSTTDHHEQEQKIQSTSRRLEIGSDHDAPEPFPNFDVKEGDSGRSSLHSQEDG